MKKSRLTVAVVIPTIPGREDLLERAVASVRAQRRPPDQVVIERDTMRTGAAASRNRALERVRTDVVSWLDDDDFLGDNHLIVCMRPLTADPGTGLVYPIPRMVGGLDPTATTAGGRFPSSPWKRRFDAEAEFHLRHFGSFIPMTHLVRTDLVREIGGFRDGYKLPDGRYRGEDEDYLIRLLDAGVRFEHMPRPTWYWQVHNQHTAGKAARP